MVSIVICCVKVKRVDKRELENCGSRAGIRQFQCELPLFPLLSLSNLENTALKNDALLLRTGSQGVKFAQHEKNLT